MRRRASPADYRVRKRHSVGSYDESVAACFENVDLLVEISSDSLHRSYHAIVLAGCRVALLDVAPLAVDDFREAGEIGLAGNNECVHVALGCQSRGWTATLSPSDDAALQRSSSASRCGGAHVAGESRTHPYAGT